MGRLELPIPQFGQEEKTLKAAAKNMQARIRKQTPQELRNTIIVSTYKKGDRTGLAIEYDDRAENYVYTAMEYPKGSRKEESAVPRH